MSNFKSQLNYSYFIFLVLFFFTFFVHSSSDKIGAGRYLAFLESLIYDFETRGLNTEVLKTRFNDAERLYENKKYSEVEQLTQRTIQETNEFLKTQNLPRIYDFEGVRFYDASYDIRGKICTAFVSEPLKDKKGKGIIFLHGAGGNRIFLKRAIHFWAGLGYICLAPSYNTSDLLHGQFEIQAWIDFFKNFPGVTPPLGAISYSKGSHFIYSLTHPEDIKCWINFYGAIHPDLINKEKVASLNIPVLIFHGGKDKIIPLRVSKKLAKAYQKANVPFELRIFEEEGHGFSDKHKEELRQAMKAFLERYL